MITCPVDINHLYRLSLIALASVVGAAAAVVADVVIAGGVVAGLLHFVDIDSDVGDGLDCK